MTFLCPFRDRVHPLTLDNGTEGAEHERIAQSLSATVYLAHPDRSWERGTNENTNVLACQYIPRYRDLSTVPESNWVSEPPMRYSSTPELHSRLHFQLEPALYTRRSIAQILHAMAL